METNNLISKKNHTKYICVASGPSLTKEDIQYIKDHRTDHVVLVINDNYRIAPWAEYLYACDGKWWDYHIEQVRKTYKGECWTQEIQQAKDYKLNLVTGDHRPGLGKQVIHYGSNSGYQAINLCFLWGAKEIMLIGYDMKKDKNNSPHWFGNHPCGLNQNSPYDAFAKNFTKLALDLEREGVKVINCTRSTVLNCFKKQSLEEYFKIS